MAGLHQRIAGKRAALSAERVTERSIHADPRDAHVAGERAAAIDRDLAALCHQAHVAEACHADLASVIARLDEFGLESSDIAIAAAHAMDALLRIRHHLGPKPR